MVLILAKVTLVALLAHRWMALKTSTRGRKMQEFDISNLNRLCIFARGCSLSTNMCTSKRGKSDVEDGEETGSDSDVSMTDSDSDDDVVADENETLNDSDSEDNAEEEEEDEVIQAIRRENERKRDHPPDITCEELISDICFHPNEDVIAVSLLTGDVLLYKYTNESNELASTLELHTKACRDIEFGSDGKLLYSIGKDQAIMVTDVQTEKLVRFYEGAHEVPIYCVTVLDENIFATGDDDGRVKLWDLRIRDDDRQIYTIKRNEDYISDIITNEDQKYLLCSSGDGCLTTVDLHNR